MKGDLVAVLGCGPAGLFAAKAIELCGGFPVLVSKKQKSQIYGAQYLHAAIPEFSEPVPSRIEGIKIGLGEHYARRVYGDSSMKTSWDRLKASSPCWSLSDAYDRAWDHYEGGIVDSELDASDVGEFSAGFPLVISTVPRWSTCYGGHNFESIDIVVEPIVIDVPFSSENFVAYNGMRHGDWYRTSRIFGYESTEYIKTQNTEPSADAKYGIKIVGNNCDCHPNVVFAGRFGLWQRGVLTHHAFSRAVEAYTERFPRALHSVR
jgi:hypothetical protein